MLLTILYIAFDYRPADPSDSDAELIGELSIFGFTGIWVILNVLISAYVGIALLFKKSLLGWSGNTIVLMVFVLILFDIPPIALWTKSLMSSVALSDVPWTFIVILIHVFLLSQILKLRS
jgi:hypothetical protein